ncbi:MAG: hypothetical protein AABW91_02375 [Nanoarchaeota archaeon]
MVRMIKGKKGAEGIPWFIILIVLGITAAFIAIVYMLYVSSIANQALGIVKPEDVDIKYGSCKVSYETQSISFKSDFCQKFNPVGGSLIFGTNNYISCQYRPIVERLYQEGIVEANDLAGSVAIINRYCKTDTVEGAKDGDEKAFATSFCKIKMKSGQKSESIWINGFTFDSSCNAASKTYPVGYTAPTGGSGTTNTKTCRELGFSWVILANCPVGKDHTSEVGSASDIVSNSRNGEVCCAV